MAEIIDPSDIAKEYRFQINQGVTRLATPLRLVGLLLADAGRPSETYASYTKSGCDDVGIQFDLRRIGKLEVESAIDAANADPDVHGVIIYYPIFGTDRDRYIKDLVDPRKDIEGLNTYWARKLYHNDRFSDPTRTKKAILPCTPLAVVKLIEAAGAFIKGADKPLAGKKITIFNRSEVVGRPLATMLANDGAEVFSFDIDGPLLFADGAVLETSVTRAAALAQSDIVVTGVPSRNFPLVRAAEIRGGTVCVNFSTVKNYADDVHDHASVFIPRVGPMTVAMALRNTLRLRDNFHSRV